MTIKQKIPKALREQVWLRQFGRIFEAKCPISWCNNIITVFDFECGHNQPESKEGKTILDNLIPICSRCNKSMSNNYTIEQWNKIDIDLIDSNKKDVKRYKKEEKCKKIKKIVKRDGIVFLFVKYFYSFYFYSTFLSILHM